MLILPSDLKEFAALLEAHDVRYLVVGGYAVAHHGFPRYTGDIDFFIEVSEENANRLAEVIRDFGFADAGVERADFLDYGSVVQLGRPPSRIDLITRLDGVSFEEAWPKRERGGLNGIQVWYIDRASLIANKQAAGRPKDLTDVSQLEADH